MITKIVHTLNSFEVPDNIVTSAKIAWAAVTSGKVTSGGIRVNDTDPYLRQQTIPLGVLDLSVQSNVAQCNFVNRLNVDKIYAYVIDGTTSGIATVTACGNDRSTQVSGGVMTVSGLTGTVYSVTTSGNALFTPDQKITLFVSSGCAKGKAVFLGECTIKPAP